MLTTGWLEGEKLSQSKADDVAQLVNLGVICYLKQLLDTGFLHVRLVPLGCGSRLLLDECSSCYVPVLVNLGVICYLKQLLDASFLHVCSLPAFYIMDLAWEHAVAVLCASAVALGNWLPCC